ANGSAKRLIKQGQVFNRIHVSDIAGSLRHLAETDHGGIFNVTDDLPAPPQDVVVEAAAIMGVPPPPEMPFDEAELTPMARSFYGENKRVSNAAIKKSGYRFLYPDYHAALAALWRDGNWRGAEAADRRSPIRS
ncbi:MAG: NAD(P)-dependent oxidoreductase, partial [Rhizobiaceae bacterium]|nr:NAD(P)-dependent oxidoreductase [Rhizobiaceae bacterium]